MDNFDRDAEALVRRLKKADLAKHIALINREAAEQRRRMHDKYDDFVKVENECEALRDELSKLQLIRAAMRRVLGKDVEVDDKQLSLLLRECDSDFSEDYRGIRAAEIAHEHGETLESAAKTLMVLLDACTDGRKNTLGEGPSYEELLDIIDLALTDRTEMLAKLGMTDREWSARGGACEADFDL